MQKNLEFVIRAAAELPRKIAARVPPLQAVRRQSFITKAPAPESSVSTLPTLPLEVKPVNQSPSNVTATPEDMEKPCDVLLPEMVP